MSKHSLRILIVEASGRGFLNHYSHALAFGLHLCNVDVQLLTGVRDELSDWEVPYPKQSCLEKGRSGWRCVREIIIQQQPDVVHLQWVDNPLTVSGWFNGLNVAASRLFTHHTIFYLTKKGGC